MTFNLKKILVLSAEKRRNSWEFIVIPLPSYKKSYEIQSQVPREERKIKKENILEKRVSPEIDEILGSSITSLYSGS